MGRFKAKGLTAFAPAVCSIMLAVFNYGTAYAAMGFGKAKGLEQAAELVIEHRANVEKITAVERRLAGLKIDASAGIWNFIGRSSNERNIQARARLNRDINFLENRNTALVDKLLEAYPALLEYFKSGSREPALMDMLDYIEELSLKRLSEFRFLDRSEALELSKERSRLEFLRYKAETQALKISLMESLDRSLKARKVACEDADCGSFSAPLEQRRVKLGKLIESSRASQEYLTGLIKSK